MSSDKNTPPDTAKSTDLDHAEDTESDAKDQPSHADVAEAANLAGPSDLEPVPLPNAALRQKIDEALGWDALANKDEAVARYSIGVIVLQLVAATSKYGKHAVKLLAESLEKGQSTLYRYAKVPEVFTKLKFDKWLAKRSPNGTSLNWTDFLELASAPEALRRDLLSAWEKGFVFACDFPVLLDETVEPANTVETSTEPEVHAAPKPQSQAARRNSKSKTSGSFVSWQQTQQDFEATRRASVEFMEHLPEDAGVEAVEYIKASDEMAHELAKIWTETAQKLDGLLTSAIREATLTPRLALPPSPALAATAEGNDTGDQAGPQDEEGENDNEEDADAE